MNININRVQKALEIMVESGVALLGFQLIFVILFVTNNTAQLIVVSFLSQVYVRVVYYSITFLVSFHEYLRYSGSYRELHQPSL